jgi:hypothetical protein
VTEESRPRESGWGYPGSVVAAAVLATLAFPVLSLIAALYLLGREQDERKRAGLRTWAWSAGGLLAIGVLAVALLAFAVTSHSSG